MAIIESNRGQLFLRENVLERTQTPTILCIDDTPEVRRLVARLLSRHYRVIEAADGLQGIELARTEAPDLILVDLHMPHFSGYEVTTRIRSFLPDTPIIALTADITEHVRERALASGCSGYLAKPIDPDEFLAQVTAYLGGQREELQDESFREAYLQSLVARMEQKVRELTTALQENAELNAQNQRLLQRSQRRAHLLEVAARVGSSVTSILDLNELLSAMVNTICDEFGFYYAGVFLLDETGDWAVLRAGRGEAGQKMLAEGHRLRVGGHSMIGRAIVQREPVLSADVEGESTHFKNPHLPETRSELALPLMAMGEVIGALSVQSTAPDAFDEDDLNALQAMTDQLAIAIRNARLHEENQRLLADVERRARLLRAAAEVGRTVTSILDLDQLLTRTVDLICQVYGFYYAGVFLVDETGEWAVLRAGYGEAGAQMVAQGHRLKVGGFSMIGTAISQRRARIALDVGEEPVHFKNPYLPLTRSEMALPLVIGERCIGAVTVQSVEGAAFSEDDITGLQAMADQLAVAINNAYLVRDLEKAHEELVRTKTYEAIATATGEAIHWVGNRAAPIPGSVARIREDIARYLWMVRQLLDQAPPALRDHPYAHMLSAAWEEVSARQVVDEAALATEFGTRSLKQLQRLLSMEFIFEDFDIIEKSARAILNIKEGLIGPARKRNVTQVYLQELVRDSVAAMLIPETVTVEVHTDPDLPPVWADPVQLDRVLINLIKNALEAMETCPVKRLRVTARTGDEPGTVAVDVTDTGTGISPENLDKIWMAFYTTKGDRGGTGLGLPACAQIIGQLGGKITVQSELGVGTTFTIVLPVRAAG